VTASEASRLDALRSEALRLNDRYLREVVVAYNLCPWAERALDAGEVRRHVIVDHAPAPDGVLPFIAELEDATAAPAPAIGLVLFPRCGLTQPGFDRFTEAVRRADRARRRAGQAPAFMLAAFHPDGADSFESAAQLVSFVRRTPDPTIQLVRASLIDRLRDARPGVSDEIARHNHATVRARGAGALDLVLRAIRRDRDESYARLALP
jgi:hypothetical protein